MRVFTSSGPWQCQHATQQQCIHLHGKHRGVAILPDNTPALANPYDDTVLCTGLGEHLGRADAVVAVGGGAGTLQEVAVAWANRRRVVVMTGVSGSTAGLAGQHIDRRGPPDREAVLGAATAAEAVQMVLAAADSS
jgi:uncharacterized protein (TIGR00725 family)